MYWCSLGCVWYNLHKLSLFQILNVKPHTLPHKSKVGASNLCSSVADKTNKEERKIYVREPAPFVSMAEMMRKFQSSTRDLSLPHVNDLNQSYLPSSTRLVWSEFLWQYVIIFLSQDAGSFTQTKPKLTLTRPKVPEFETAQRVRSTKVKSSAEIEEEMMAKMPKFKARPLNKKVDIGNLTPFFSFVYLVNLISTLNMIYLLVVLCYIDLGSSQITCSTEEHTPASWIPGDRTLKETVMANFIFSLWLTLLTTWLLQEFHLETMARANQHADSASVISTESSRQVLRSPF